MLSLKSGESTVLAFTLEERDIGGTLAVELALISHRVSHTLRNGNVMTHLIYRIYTCMSKFL